MKAFFKQQLFFLSFLFMGGSLFAQSYQITGVYDTINNTYPCDTVAELSFSMNGWASSQTSDVHYFIQATNVQPGNNVVIVVNWGDGTTTTHTTSYLAPTLPLNFGTNPVTHSYASSSSNLFPITVTVINPANNSTLTNSNYTFSINCSTQFYGFVNVDCDSNGVIDTSYASGVQIDVIGNGTTHTFTLNNSTFSTNFLSSGTYTLAINPGWLAAHGYGTVFIQPSQFFISGTSGGIFTFQTLLICDSTNTSLPGCLYGQVFCDNNGNGIFDSTDYGVYNAPITVVVNNQIITGYTNPNGVYVISANSAFGDTAIVSVDQNWLGQNGYLYGTTSSTLVLGSCQTTAGASIVNFPVNCDSVQLQTGCLYGFIFCDANGNGQLDSAEVGIANAPVILNGNTNYSLTIYTNSNGYFSYSGPAFFGTGVVATVPTWWLTQHSYILNNNVATATINCTNPTPLYFGINCSPTPCADLWTTVNPWIGYYQNQNNYIKLKWGNNGQSATTGYTLTLTYPSSVTPDPTSFLYTSNYVISGNTITWTFGPGASYIYQTDVIKFFVPSGYPSGTSHTYSSVITELGTTTDCNPLNNDGSLCMILGNSYDPNDKSVNLPPVINPDLQDELTYVLRFQNTGTAPAQDVYIMDTLSSLLDWTTLKVISASHNLQLIDLGNGVMKFNFPGIWLPDSTANEPASHGDVVFSIKENANNPVGSSITNTGYIYFDWNPAIITNTTLNTNAYLGLEDVSVNEVRVYPNPFADKITIASAKRMDKVTVLDITGKVIYQERVDGFNTNIQLDSLSQGTYLVNVSSGTETSTVRIVKK